MSHSISSISREGRPALFPYRELGSRSGSRSGSQKAHCDEDDIKLEQIRQEGSPIIDSQDISGPTGHQQGGARWVLPALILSLYLVAFLSALGHLFFFCHLDGRRVDVDTNIPQSFVAPISFAFALLFQTALRGCLHLSYSQHLWLIVRSSAHSVQDIDRLHRLRDNLFALLSFRDLSTSPLLFLLASLYWLTPIPVIFPSGAVVVTGRTFNEPASLSVPTFNSTFLGNGSNADVIRHSLVPNIPLTEDTLNRDIRAQNKLLNSATISLISDDIFSAPSTCGSNCTYKIEFDGPFAQCDKTVFNSTEDGNELLSKLFIQRGDADEPDLVFYNGMWFGSANGWAANKSTIFRFDTVSPFAYSVNSSNGTEFWQFEVTRQDFKYTRDTPEYGISTKFVDCVEDFWHPVNTSDVDLNAPFVASPENLDDLRAENLIVLIDSLVTPLTGSVICILDPPSGPTITLRNVTTPTGENLETAQARVQNCGVEFNSTNNLIQQTQFNTNREKQNSTVSDIQISEDMLNNALVNITLSAMNRLNQYSTRADVMQQVFQNVFDFENKLRLILPYFLTFGVALPFMVVGLVSLSKNGGPAPDEGFLGTIVGTAGSGKLGGAAERVFYGFGAREGVAERRLKDLRIQYGGLDGGNGRLRPAYGAEDEVQPLMRRP
ncbi:uncharacterized protein BDR25DRAFT_346417 [Lindgomyces ingoldianus]|uniref:Uncharacterized protein n=1 Tax=Lindgomyces ingoldianus TaxID=673940 RepID=A0ACB6QCV5_9PLEO|nr:uncharacterized protein BDR25DRAFT_346417 [Lindgomyces ingoldianus]KAF2464849.1 hypothetical protein BDR25DRAFT_346417 [Lindgomyces ingoldianus]